MAQVDIDKDSISCPICTDLLHRAMETCCGHAFCEACIRRWLSNHPTTCPMCKKNPQPIHASFTLRSICEQYYKKNPNHEELMLREKELGNEFYTSKQYWRAIEHYTAAMGELPENDVKRGILYNNRSQCYIKLYKYSNALADCDRAIALGISADNLVKARMRKGNCLMHMGELEACLREYQLAAQLDSFGQFAKEIQQCMSMLPPPQELPNSMPELISNAQRPPPYRQQSPPPVYTQPPQPPPRYSQQPQPQVPIFHQPPPIFTTQQQQHHANVYSTPPVYQPPGFVVNVQSMDASSSSSSSSSSSNHRGRRRRRKECSIM